MSQTSFDAASFVQFDLENGLVSTLEKKPVALVPLEVLSTLEPGEELHEAASSFGRLHGKQLQVNLQGADQSPGVQELAEHLAGTAAVLGLGRLSVEIFGDALILRIGSTSEDSATSSRGYQALLCGFFSGYLNSLSSREFQVIPLDVVDSDQRYLASNPNAAKKVIRWMSSGTDTITAIGKLSEGNTEC
jgi:hypothetical protein